MGFFHHKPSIIGYPHLWKPPYLLPSLGRRRPGRADAARATSRRWKHRGTPRDMMKYMTKHGNLMQFGSENTSTQCSMIWFIIMTTGQGGTHFGWPCLPRNILPKPSKSSLMFCPRAIWYWNHYLTSVSWKVWTPVAIHGVNLQGGTISLVTCGAQNVGKLINNG